MKACVLWANRPDTHILTALCLSLLLQTSGTSSYYAYTLSLVAQASSSIVNHITTTSSTNPLQLSYGRSLSLIADGLHHDPPHEHQPSHLISSPSSSSSTSSDINSRGAGE